MLVTPQERRVLESISERGEEIVARAVGWCAGNSGSRNIEGLQATLDLLTAAWGEALPGAAVSHEALEPTVEIAADGRETLHQPPPSLLLTMRPQAPVQVVMTGHYDTVFPAGSPFQAVGRREDGALNGPGIADMKGGISVMMAALEAFEGRGGSGFAEAGNLGWRVLLSPDEEIGSLGSGAVLSRIGRLGHVGMTYEPALADGTLAAGRKGSGNFHVKVTGRSAHAGRAFDEGRNAITAAARIAGALDGLNGGRDGVTVNVARIDGGSALNVVPDLAVVRFNVRFPDAEAARWLEGGIERACACGRGDGLGVAMFGGITRAAKPFNGAQAALFEEVRRVGAALGQPIAWKPSGGVCEGNNLFAVGLPNVDTLGVRGGDIHSENEFAWPESFVERAQLSALMLMKMASGEVDARRLHEMMKGGA